MTFAVQPFAIESSRTCGDGQALACAYSIPALDLASLGMLAVEMLGEPVV